MAPLLSLFGEVTAGTIIVPILYLLGLFGFVSYFLKGQEGENGIRWSPLESAAVTLFIYFFSQLFVGMIFAVVLGLLGWDQDRISDWFSGSVYSQFILGSAIQIVTVGLLLLFLKRRKANLKTIGFKGRPKFRDGGYAILGYGVYIALFIVASKLVEVLIPAVDLDQKQQLGFDKVGSAQLPFVFISLVILPPLVEELVVRGFLYTGLKQKLPRLRAALLTSVIFGVAHLQAGSGAPLLWVAAIDTFILSMVLINLKERTGNLWAPICLHALKNLIAFLSLFVFHLV